TDKTDPKVNRCSLRGPSNASAPQKTNSNDPSSNLCSSVSICGRFCFLNPSFFYPMINTDETQIKRTQRLIGAAFEVLQTLRPHKKSNQTTPLLICVNLWPIFAS